MPACHRKPYPTGPEAMHIAAAICRWTVFETEQFPNDFPAVLPRFYQLVLVGS
jgi:hypothetical protein